MENKEKKLVGHWHGRDAIEGEQGRRNSIDSIKEDKLYAEAKRKSQHQNELRGLNLTLKDLSAEY